MPDSAPSVGAAIRAALSDLYFNSWRLVPANLLWSITALAVLVVVAVSPVGLLVLPVLAVPTAGLFRMSGRIARGVSVSFWDAAAAWRTDLSGTLVLGGGLALAAVVLSINLATGVSSGSPLGWAFATLAFWGVLAAWLYAWTAWPILCDPARAAWPVRDRLGLGALLVLAHPVRLGSVSLVLAVFLIASVVAIVAIVTVSVAIAAVIAARYVLPAADRLDAQLGFARSRGLQEVATAAD